MQFGILGPLQARVGGALVSLGGPKQRALLAILLLNANRVVGRDRLIELVWGDEPPESAVNTLQVHVSQLRHALEPERSRGAVSHVLQNRPSGYVLVVEPDQVDVERFLGLANTGREALSAAEHREAAMTLREALALWRGPALADVDAPFASAERMRLEDLRLAALEDRVKADLALGMHTEVIAELQSLTAQYPLRERLCGQLMLALYRSGRPVDASAAYHRLRQALDEAEGMEPGQGLQELLIQILNQDPALQLEPRRVSSLRTGKHNLPLQLSSFVGREDEVRKVRGMIGANRLVTLTGTGGVGKTRLALEVASSFDGTYPDGVWLVELGGLADPTLVPQALASALDIHEQMHRPVVETLLVLLRRSDMFVTAP